MKPLLLFLFLGTVPVSAVFSQEKCQADGACFIATVDSEIFKFRDYWPLNAVLMNQEASLDGRMPEKTIISVMLNGPSYLKIDSSFFDESIQLEIKYDKNMTAEPSLYSIGLQFLSTVYSMITGQGEFKITQFVWADDNRSFRLSAEFDCSMRSWGYPMDGKKDVRLKGKMTNVLINIPGWIYARE